MFTHSSKTGSNKPKAVSEKVQRASDASSDRLSTQNVMRLQSIMGSSGLLQLLQLQSLQQSAGLPVQRREAKSNTSSNPLVNRFRIPRQFHNQVQRGNDSEMERHKNNTGLPDNIKAGVENLSGLAMDNVRVHYNSGRPAQVGALAYTKGTDIHVAPGQEQHLPHEAWHVVQQKQGWVKPTRQMKGTLGINDDKGLEKEADIMGMVLQRKSQDMAIYSPQNSAQLKKVDSSKGVLQRTAHPLANDDNEINCELMDSLHISDPKGTVKNLIFEDTIAAQKAMESYKQARKTGKADAMLFKSILATIELHKSGAIAALTGFAKERELTNEEQRLLQIAKIPYDSKAMLIKEYGLDDAEVRSIEAYSLPDKNDPKNKYFMGSNGKWGKYPNGWTALENAMKKLPSLGKLGLEVTSYRAVREGESEASGALDKMQPETNIVHGTKKMEMGQKHYTSTALTYNPHWARTKKVGGMMAFTGKSGVLINPFGAQGFVDGAEILYPPEIVTRYQGKNPVGYEDQGSKLPVFHMREVTGLETGQALVDDDKYETVKPKDKKLDSEKMEIIKEIENTVSKNGRAILEDARSSTAISGPIMYLTIDELRVLKRSMEDKENKVRKKSILQLF